jgi:hypothetical protein
MLFSTSSLLIPKKLLIISNSQACLFALFSNSFKPSLSPLIIIIKYLIFRHSLNETFVNFLWVPSHVGFAGNEWTDYLAVSTTFSPHIFLFLKFLLPISFLSIVRSSALLGNLLGPYIFNFFPFFLVDNLFFHYYLPLTI